MSGHRLNLASLMNDVCVNQESLDSGDPLPLINDSPSTANDSKGQNKSSQGVEVADSDLCSKLRYLTTFEVHQYYQA